MEGGDRPPSALAPPLTLYHPAPDRDPRRPLANDALGGALPLVVCFFFCFGWFLQTCRSRWYCTAQLLGHNGESRVTLGGTSHRRSCWGTTRKAASLSVVRHTATVVSGTTGKAGSLSVVSHTATVVGHNWESSCWLRMFSTRVAEHTSLMPHNCLSPPYCCRCIAAALPLHCRCIAAALLRLCCRSCPAALTAVVTATI